MHRLRKHTDDYDSVLISAIDGEQIEIAKWALTKPIKDYKEAIEWALMKKTLQILKLILAVYEPTERDISRMFYNTLEAGDADIVEWLLSRYNISRKNLNCYLKFAADVESLTGVMLLLNAGADGYKNAMAIAKTNQVIADLIEYYEAPDTRVRTGPKCKIP